MKKTHDLSSRTWGNNYSVMSIENKGHTINLTGWRKGISIGDYLIICNGSDTTRYIVQQIDYQDNPEDMFFATVRFAPRDSY